ncbi:hypothetical protein RQP46_001501 [Phenoliferia psychrophenolica]
MFEDLKKATKDIEGFFASWNVDCILDDARGWYMTFYDPAQTQLVLETLHGTPFQGVRIQLSYCLPTAPFNHAYPVVYPSIGNRPTAPGAGIKALDRPQEPLEQPATGDSDSPMAEQDLLDLIRESLPEEIMDLPHITTDVPPPLASQLEQSSDSTFPQKSSDTSPIEPVLEIETSPPPSSPPAIESKPFPSVWDEPEDVKPKIEIEEEDVKPDIKPKLEDEDSKPDVKPKFEEDVKPDVVERRRRSPAPFRAPTPPALPMD